mgnify:CR=1 FL=1
MGATKERRAELKAERHNHWLQEYCRKNKFLADPKFYKNNRWSVAAFDSWAAQGKNGSCPCGCGYYNATLTNTRAANKWCKQVSVKLCYKCKTKIQDIIGVEFPQF